MWWSNLERRRSLGKSRLLLLITLSLLPITNSTSSDKKHSFDPLSHANLVRVNCNREFEGKEWTALWYAQSPYAYPSMGRVNRTTMTSVGGIVAVQLQQILQYCCSENVVESIDYTELNTTDSNISASNLIQRELIYGNAAMGFPLPTPLRPNLEQHFVGVVPSPGAVYLVKNTYTPVSILTVVSGAWVLLCFVLVSAALAGIVMWGLESLDRKNSMFSRDFLPGIFDGFWFSIVTMTSVGFGDITPRTKVGKFVGLLWMLLGTITLSLFTATVTTSLTTSTLSIDTQLRGARVAAVRGSEATKIAILNGAKVTFEAENPAEAMKAVLNETVEGVVLDQLIAGDLITSSTDSDVTKLRLAKLLMSQVMHGILFSPNRTTGLMEQCADLVMAEQEHETYLDVEELISALQSRQTSSGPRTSTASIFSNDKDVIYITCYMLAFVFLFAWVCDCLYHRSFYPNRKKNASQTRSHHRQHQHHHHHHHRTPHSGLSGDHKRTPISEDSGLASESLPETARLLPSGESIQYGSTDTAVRPRTTASPPPSSTSISTRIRSAVPKHMSMNGDEDARPRTWSPMHNPVSSTDSQSPSTSPLPPAAAAAAAAAAAQSHYGSAHPDRISEENESATASSASTGTSKSLDDDDDDDNGDYISQASSPAAGSPVPIAAKQLVYMQRGSYSQNHASRSSSASRMTSPRSGHESAMSRGSTTTPPPSDDVVFEESRRATASPLIASAGSDAEAFVLAEQGHEVERLESEYQQTVQAWAMRRRDMLLRHQNERAGMRQQQQRQLRQQQQKD